MAGYKCRAKTQGGKGRVSLLKGNGAENREVKQGRERVLHVAWSSSHRSLGVSRLHLSAFSLVDFALLMADFWRDRRPCLGRHPHVAQAGPVVLVAERYRVPAGEVAVPVGDDLV